MSKKRRRKTAAEPTMSPETIKQIREELSQEIRQQVREELDPTPQPRAPVIETSTVPTAAHRLTTIMDAETRRLVEAMLDDLRRFIEDRYDDDDEIRAVLAGTRLGRPPASVVDGIVTAVFNAGNAAIGSKVQAKASPKYRRKPSEYDLSRAADRRRVEKASAHTLNVRELVNHDREGQGLKPIPEPDHECEEREAKTAEIKAKAEAKAEAKRRSTPEETASRLNKAFSPPVK